MSQMWNERYATEDYLFGTEPAAFLPAHEAWFKPAQSVLAIADGEGRNSVWIAERGPNVTAFDPSPNALLKAGRLAQAKGVDVSFNECGINEWDWSRTFDVVAGIFIQFVPPQRRAQLFTEIDRAVAPGGLLLLHGYTPKQIDYGTGGPPDPANMYTPDLLAESFATYEIYENRAYEAVIEEGKGHSGRSALIDFVARKPA